MHDLTTVDIWSFCKASKFVQKSALLSKFERLSSSVTSFDQSEEFHWSVAGARGSGGRCEITLAGSFNAGLNCRVCDKPVERHFEFSRHLLLFKTEKEADTFDNENDDIDAVVAANQVNLLDWVEDEAILTLPMFVMHTQCEEFKAAATIDGDNVSSADNTSDQGESESLKKPNPFAVLASLKKSSS
jgi:uncharacterized protein